MLCKSSALKSGSTPSSSLCSGRQRVTNELQKNSRVSEKSTLCLLTDHLQGVHVDVATHHPALGVQLGAAKADRHADLSVPVTADRQPALTLQPAGGPAAGANTTVSTS